MSYSYIIVNLQHQAAVSEYNFSSEVLGSKYESNFQALKKISKGQNKIEPNLARGNILMREKNLVFEDLFIDRTYKQDKDILQFFFLLPMAQTERSCLCHLGQVITPSLMCGYLQLKMIGDKFIGLLSSFHIVSNILCSNNELKVWSLSKTKPEGFFMSNLLIVN